VVHLCVLKVDLLKDSLLDRLVEIVGSDVVSLTSDHDVIEYNICQLALMGLQLLCRLLGGRNPELFSSVSGVWKLVGIAVEAS
jgi:hypothetical protein